MTDCPCRPVAGVTLMVRFWGVLVAKVRWAASLGTRVGLEDEAVTTRSLGVSVSLTVKLSGPVEPFSGSACLGIEVIVGDVFAPATSAKWVPTRRSLT